MKINFLFISLLFTTLTYSREVRFINPPKFDISHIEEKKIGYRPYRKSGPLISLEKHDEKTIIHNYGHGGSGWSIGPASASYAVTLLTSHTPSVSKDSKIAIIGGGCIGLFTAFELLCQGFSNLTIYADSFNDLTSHLAGGLLAPVILNETAIEQEFIHTLGISSYIFYKQIAEGKNANFSQGARFLPTYYLDKEHSELEPYVGIVINEPKEVLLDFKNGHTQPMLAYDDGIFIETELMMERLHQNLKNKALFIQKHIDKFDNLEESIIFNCSGLGANKLHPDENLVAHQGHLILLKNQTPEDLQYMLLIDFQDGITTNGKTIKRCFHIFPKHVMNSELSSVGVIGGTMIEESEPNILHLEEFDNLINQAKNFYGIN